jgi:hypothetical protein
VKLADAFRPVMKKILGLLKPEIPSLLAMVLLTKSRGDF